MFVSTSPTSLALTGLQSEAAAPTEHAEPAVGRSLSRVLDVMVGFVEAPTVATATYRALSAACSTGRVHCR